MKAHLRSASPELKALLKKRAPVHTYEANEELFAVGDRADFLPIIVTGSVEMIQFPEAGKEVILDIFHDGQMFAIPPVIDGKTYPASAVALEKTKVMMLSRQDFFDLLRESQEFLMVVLGWMSEMLRQKTATIQTLAGASPEQRVSSVLVRLVEADGGTPPVRIKTRREDIGKMAGLTTETTIRVIRKMKEKGLIRIERGKIVVESLETLKSALDG
jgi:CRP-like cAMP-binding protein